MAKRKIGLFVSVLVLVWLIANFQPASAGFYDCTNDQTAIPATECEALMDLYMSTGGNTWYTRTGWWTVATSPCDWYGIDCTAGSSGYVSVIQLPVNNLVGELPATLSNLTHLDRISLAVNEFTGGIPPELGSITSLTELHLHRTELTGSIPPELGNLVNLTDLVLNNNDLTGSVPATLGNLTNLENLSLSSNYLSGILPATLANLTQVSSAFLYFNLFCEPDDAAFQAWKASVVVYDGTGTCQQDMFYSLAQYDGWVRESGEDTNAGGAVDNDMLTCFVGDDGLDRQYRTILHFNTSRMPNNAVVSKVTLQYKQHSIIGDDPSATHGSLWADIRKGQFSANPILEAKDFSAAGSLLNAGKFSLVPSGSLYPLFRTTLKTNALQYINQFGNTQFRLHFTLDDNDDNSADYIKIFCGDMDVPFNRPVLRVWYHIPVS